MRIYDLSPLLEPGLAVWPGDRPFSREVALSMAAGAHLDLSSIHTTVHLGAHADAPSHYGLGADTIERVDLAAYVGPCQLMRVDVARGERIHPRHLTGAVTAPRLLLRTGTFPDPRQWNEDFASLSPELVDHLHGLGVVLVGLDTPSVDPFASKALESHQALLRTGLRNLEGLLLDDVPEGLYTLVALPLRLAGADASPVRAVLLGA
ncbi:MAG TPA: cyclase family protein [Holophagaceae bacterium]|nr:cyclase family protein [Holophagaceae bacterium]